MAKSISLRKMWHLCNEAIKLNLNDSQKNSAAMDAYKLLLNNESSEVVNPFQINQLSYFIYIILGLGLTLGR